MIRLTRFARLLFAAALTVALSGCADNRMDGGYTDAVRPMNRLSTPAKQVAPAQSQLAPSPVTQSPVTQGNGPVYVYRGGRDPVTGNATLSY